MYKTVWSKDKEMQRDKKRQELSKSHLKKNGILNKDKVFLR